MLFICKLGTQTRIGGRFPVRVDPSCAITPYRTSKGYAEKELILHHYSMIRQDIRSKFKNAAASINWNADKFVEEYENYDIVDNPGVSYFSGDGVVRKIKVVPNWFRILVKQEIITHHG